MGAKWERLEFLMEVNMPVRKRTTISKSMEGAAVRAGGELGAAVGRLEKQAREIGRRRDELETNARQRSIRLLQSAARSLDKLASQLKSSGKRKRARRKSR
jgi:hypothetical protein